MYRNYSKRRENTAFILGMVAFSVLSLPVFGRTLNIVGSLAAIIFAVLFYRAKKTIRGYCGENSTKKRVVLPRMRETFKETGSDTR